MRKGLIVAKRGTWRSAAESLGVAYICVVRKIGIKREGGSEALFTSA